MSFRVRCKHIPRERSNLDENQWASCVSQLCLYHCYSISADAAVCKAESLSELTGQQQRMCRSLIRSVMYVASPVAAMQLETGCDVSSSRSSSSSSKLLWWCR